ncbi:restriction endonuclease subunit S [Ligilactobacillus ruminis]|uniref:restriction endonuclease subunit S n=2 Tax=Ligilactobacillus ruminis TaxID=1623 RepID=UPI00307C6D3D
MIAWKQRKLNEVLSFLKDGTHGTHADDENGPLLLSAKNIKNGKIICDETDRRISEEEYEKIHTNFSLEVGDVLLTIVGSIGETAILKDCSSITFQRSVAFLRPNGTITSDFLYSEIQTQKFQNELDSRKSTSAQPGIYLGDLSEVPIVFTTNLDEQTKIGDYFNNLDHLITLHQQKITLLTKLKKAMLEKMFPKKGSVIPEIRFNGFANAWEQRKVSELFRVTRGYVLAATQTETEKTDEKPYPVYSSQTKDKGLMGYYKDYLYEDAITWTTDGANAGTVNYRAGKFYCTNVCGVLLSNEVKANQMIAEALNNVAKGYVSYVGNPKLMNNVMADIVIQIPTHPEEREQISSFFANLDHLITLHQRKIDKLKNLKKAMLDQMFI